MWGGVCVCGGEGVCVGEGVCGGGGVCIFLLVIPIGT